MPEDKIQAEMGDKTILLVEDDPFLSSLLTTRLQKAGLKVVRAMTGEEALSILRAETKPDLILLDIILPQKSGFEVLEEIQADPTLDRAPVIITSNLGQSSDIERGKQLGVINYFVKAQMPIDTLVEEIKKVVNK
ncbi:MAG: response regulator [Candidatus Colwellbacteria bacterium CG10_big_fil_rev_8_21_14_0_10_42_22]|uniref:Response regulator n=1 Tax=Candidatus Colwellbacteria bacterium CG10_big_fil_rev_8_21_14_0_10_42_22 TaxID=1974540 RepID=A0A2H0VGJ9_9BACT|nr:MAG: response regulator [Candidatus Colwellbacteria bacterium CG10_big_fil_rev_8_21_14_0_10_42_22]